MAYLIADSGSTTCEWCIVNNNKKTKFTTIGINPYFLSKQEIVAILLAEVLPQIGKKTIDNIYFYGTGLGNIANTIIVKSVLKTVFPTSKIDINTDMLAAARSLLINKKGIACILGTGSNIAFYDGKKNAKSSPGLGYILGDEGSGSYLGKKVLQYYLYNLQF